MYELNNGYVTSDISPAIVGRMLLDFIITPMLAKWIQNPDFFPLSLWSLIDLGQFNWNSKINIPCYNAFDINSVRQGITIVSGYQEWYASSGNCLLYIE